jgi:7,8-dihydroneopterin aldolase/epimerase/oxygenase
MTHYRAANHGLVKRGLVKHRRSSALFWNWPNRYYLCSITGVTMDIIFLHDLTIETIIGIYDWERKEKQSIILDLDMAADIPRAAKTDAIEDTLNYKAVAKRLIEYVGASEFQLVETLAERVAEIVLNEFGVKWLRLRVNKKGAVRYAGDVGVIIERGTRG